MPPRRAMLAASGLVVVACAAVLAVLGGWVRGVVRSASSSVQVGLVDAAGERWRASQIVGPEGTARNCAACHLLEDQAWQRTHHFTGFARRHRTTRAQQILRNLGQTTMRRQGDCRQCHYTSVLEDDHIMPQWGVSCESCHGPAKDWVKVHDRAGGDEHGAMLHWGDGKRETAAARDARLSVAEQRGMVTSRMVYDLALRCLRCHVVGDERLVNVGGHPTGNTFDMVAWSQGEIRHNFVDSRGAPDRPTNRRLTAAERRRMYVAGAVADLQISLWNLAAAHDREGDFGQSMLERANDDRDRLGDILAAVDLPELAAVVAQVPRHLSAGTRIAADLPARLAAAGRTFAARYDGSSLAALDGQIPTDVVGTPYRR